jgi:cobalt/nickel transport protein
MSPRRRLWAALLVLGLLSPLGLYLPEVMRAGAAWGEWGLEEVRELVGYVPAGMERSAEMWRAPLPDYALPGADTASAARLGLGYVFSALAGMAACAAGAYVLGRWLHRGRR